MSMPSRTTEGGTYRYGFNGKEKDTETDLNDFGARFYAANLGRWLSIDPLAAKFPNWSPYNAMNDNPMFFIDPDGMEVTDYVYINKKGEEIGRIKDKKIERVTIIADENLEKFRALPYKFESIAEAEKMGITYNIKSLKMLWEKSKRDNVTEYKCFENIGKNRPKHNIKREWAGFLYLTKENTIEILDMRRREFDHVDYDEKLKETKKYKIIGTAHTHPNEGKGLTTCHPNGVAINVYFNDKGPSTRDQSSLYVNINDPLPGYYSVVLDSKYIYFYDKKNTIKIKRNE